MIKPIEPGCLAVVTGAHNNPWTVGCVVQVHEKTHRGEIHNGLINTFRMDWAWVATGAFPGGAYSYHDPRHLLRIDGHEPETETQQQDEEIPLGA